MKKWLKWLIILMLMFLLAILFKVGKSSKYCVGCNLDISDSDEDIISEKTRHNGTSWFWFGQAVIDCAQSAECSFGYGEEHGEEEEIVITDQEDLTQIKAFVKKHFFEKFGFSPTIPDGGRNIRYVNVIILYSIPLSPDDESPHYEEVLVHIPISSQTTEGQYDGVVKEYHELIKAILNRRK